MNPRHSSALKLKQSYKYWAKDDEMLLADLKLDQAPQDPFK